MKVPKSVVALSGIVLLLVSGVGWAEEDLTPPVLLGLSRSPAVIDTANSNQIVAFTWELKDDLSGIEIAQLQLRSPSGNQTALSTAFQSDLVSGTPLQGIYGSTMFFHQYCERGIWQPCHFWLSDEVGNYLQRGHSYPDGEISDMIEAMDLDLNVTVAPEPSTFILLSIGVLSFLAYVWWRRSI